MQQQTISRPQSPRPITIEVEGEPLGVVVPSDDGYRFLAVRLPAFGIDGVIFESVDAARRAAAELIEAAA